MSDLEIDIAALEKRMDGALQRAAHRVRLAPDRARFGLDARSGDGGSLRLARMPINQLGTITVPEPRMVLVNVWDKALVNTVDKAIRNSGLGSTRRWTAPSCGCRSRS